MSHALGNGLRRVHIAGCDRPELAWCEGLDVSFPRSVLSTTGLERGIDSRGHLAIGPEVPVVDRRMVHELRLHAAFTPTAPISARLPVSYRKVPGPVRRALARGLGRWQRTRAAHWAAFPNWPLDLSADVLADFASQATPATGATPVLLTHDIDSPDGLRNLVDRFLPLEEAVGARSTNYVVPCAWELDERLLAEVHGRGHELGIHGYDHANRTPFASPEERRNRLHAPRALAKRFGMIGYRAPSLLRTRELLADLEGLYRYDSSIPTSGGLFPVPNNGCATARPFRIGSLVEIPISLPRDGSLRFLGYSPDAILDLWKTCADRVARGRGVVVLLTHCEDHFSGNGPMLERYRAFLDWLAEDGRFRWSRASEIAAAVPA